jgi:hypothetical protein
MIQRSSEQLLEDALKLTPAERSRLAAQLIESLDDFEPDDPTQWDEKWLATAQRRDAELESGEVKAISAEDPLAPPEEIRFSRMNLNSLACAACWY